MAAPNINPLLKSYPPDTPQVSSKTFHIAGILTDVYGLDELPVNCNSVSCLWLLHPRLSDKQRMANIAATSIIDWQQRRGSSPHPTKGLIAIAFDQRNHGTRLVDKLANEAWRSGNERHAQDMFRYFS
jgi:hypothetical protein